MTRTSNKALKSKKENTSTELLKPLSKEEVKERLARTEFFDDHPENIYKKIGAMLGKKKKNDKWTEDEEKYLNKYLRSIDNFSKSHVGLAETQAEGNLRTIVIEFANNLIEEYQCQTTLEKSLCEVIAENYGKVMQISKKFTGVMIAGEYLSDERTRYLGMLSKEKEKAERMYLASLQSLIDIKRPQSNILIKTQTAYMAQYQQINTNQEANVENIKTK